MQPITTNSITRRINQSRFDNVYTPAYAVKPLLKYFPKGSIIYEPFSIHDNNITKTLKKNGVNVLETGMELDGTDFFDVKDTPAQWIVSNPPFSIKDAVIKHTLDMGVRFFYLLPIDVLAGVARHKMYEGQNISFIAFNRRVDFTGKRKPHTYVGWLTNYFDTSKLVFENLEVSEKKNEIKSLGDFF